MRVSGTLSEAVTRPIRAAANIIPKKRTLVLFGARMGNWYADCSRQVYEHVVATRPELDPVWMTRDKQVLRRLKQEGLPVCNMNSLRALYLLWRSPLAVISTQLYDIARTPSLIPASLRLVFLGHGKSAKASTLAFKSGRSEGFKRMFHRTANQTEVAVSTSPFVSRLSAKANGFPLDRFEVTGYPRNDPLVHPGMDLKKKWHRYLDGLQPDRVVLYAPTWRQRGERTRFFPFEDFDPEALARSLEETRTLLLVRPHERDLLNHPDLQRFLVGLDDKSPWIRVCDQRVYQNVNHVLPFTDALVTDYSSICNDYLLLDRPMVFIPYDHEEFSQVQGFMYDYFATLPGPAVSDQKGFLSTLEDLANGKDPYKRERHALRDKIHVHTDGRSTERVLEIIEDRLYSNGSSTLKNTKRTGTPSIPAGGSP